MRAEMPMRAEKLPEGRARGAPRKAGTILIGHRSGEADPNGPTCHMANSDIHANQQPSQLGNAPELFYSFWGPLRRF